MNKILINIVITFASILDSQNKNTNVRFHIAVVLNFTAQDMLKIYSLRKTIRENCEFNFYNASKVEKDLNGLNVKGPGAVAKLLLPTDFTVKTYFIVSFEERFSIVNLLPFFSICL